MTFSRRSRRRKDDIPEINLVPMMDVLMTILTFFIIVSMTLGAEEQIEVKLPPKQQTDKPAQVGSADDLFIVQFDAEQRTLLNGVNIPEADLADRIEAYLARNPKNVVYLVPDQDLPYQDVVAFLGRMREVGGERVSLALEENK
jgi:biopolymer transport protein ExbD